MPYPSSSPRTVTGWRTTILVTAPLVTAIGHAYQPWIGRAQDAVFFWRLAALIDDDPGRWALSQLLIVAGTALLAGAFVAIRGLLRDAGEERWSVVALPLAVTGGALLVVPPAIGFALWGAYEAQLDAGAVLAALIPSLTGIRLGAAALLAAGLGALAVAVVRVELLPRPVAWVVAAALAAFALSRFFSYGILQLYVGPAAALLALWPLAYAARVRGREL